LTYGLEEISQELMYVLRVDQRVRRDVSRVDQCVEIYMSLY